MLGMPLINVLVLQQWLQAAILLLRVVSSGMSKHMVMSKQLLEGAVLEVSQDRGLPKQIWIVQMMETWSVKPRELGRLFLSF